MHAMLLATLLTGKVDAAVGLVMHTQHIAGLSLGIERDGRVVYERGYGERDVSLDLPAQAQTVYRIGSLSKSFTAAAILRLADQHRMSLNDPIAKYVTVPRAYDAVTVGELLAHTSGIPSYSDSPQLDRSAQYSPQQLVDSVASRPLLFAPGSSFAYSNTNYVLLGMIAERVTGVPYGAYLRSAVLAPLGLDGTRYGDQPGEALGYRWNGAFVPAEPSSTSFAYAAAGLTSNVPDLLTWLGGLTQTSFGFFDASVYGYAVRYATGNVDGYSCLEFIAPGEHDAFVVLSNADGVDLLPLAKSIFAALEPPKPQTFVGGFGAPQNEDPATTAEVRGLISELQDGTIDRSALTPSFNVKLSQADLDRFAASLAPMGTMTLLEFMGRESAEATSTVTYRVSFSNGKRFDVAVRFAGDEIDGVTVTPH